MGNFEKLVVLTVLFLAAVVLGVSLNSRDAEGAETAGPRNPMEAARGMTQGDLASGRSGAEDDVVPAGLLSAETPGREVPPPAEVVETGPPRILVSERGLRESPYFDEYRIYTCAAGDTWTALADRFYGGTRYSALLRSANEGYDAPVANLEILVPVFDFSSEAGTRDPAAPREARPVADAPPVVPVAAGADVTTWVVRSGDSLSVISKEVYGTAHRWKEIYEANKGVLSSPDELDVGTTLRIP
jgi:phage tail protein X